MSISRSTEGTGDESVDEFGPSSVRMDTRDDHPMLASAVTEVNTDGPHTRSLTGDGKMADRPTATFGAQCGALVGLSINSDVEKEAYKPGSPSGEVLLKYTKGLNSQTVVSGDYEKLAYDVDKRKYRELNQEYGRVNREGREKSRYSEDSGEEKVTERMKDMMRFELRKLESKRRSRGLSRRRADDRSISRSGYATCSEDIDDSVRRCEVAEWKRATDVDDRSYAEEGRYMSYDSRRHKAGRDYYEPFQGTSSDWRFVDEDFSIKSKDQMPPQVGRLVSQEDLKKGVRFQEDKEELGYKVNSELYVMTEARKNLMSDAIQQAVRGAQGQIKTEYGRKHLDEGGKSEPSREKSVKFDSESRSDEEVKEGYPGSGCKSKVKRRKRQLLRECTVDSGLEEKSKRKEQKETSVDGKFEKGSIQKGKKSDEETKAEFFEKMLSRRRKEGESLQRLFVDFCRMGSVVFGGEKSRGNDFSAAEAFIAALDDETMQQRVRSRKPKDLEAAYLVALFEETEKTVDASSELGKDDEAKKSTRGKAEDKGARPKAQASKDTIREKERKKKDDSSSDEDETDKEEEVKNHKKSTGETDNSECKGGKLRVKLQSPVSATGPRFTRKEMLLENYDGTTSLAVFLGKFENCSEHNGWSEDERVRHLINALRGTAAQLAPLKTRLGLSSAQLIEKLTVRYGTEDQMATHRAKFHSCKRQKGQTLQGLYLEVSRLGGLAYPGEGSVVFDAVSVDTFINALNDAPLELRLRDKEPKSLEEAYRMAERLEAYSKGKVVDETEEQPLKNSFERHVRGAKIPYQGRSSSYKDGDDKGKEKENKMLTLKDDLRSLLREELQQVSQRIDKLEKERGEATPVDGTRRPGGQRAGLFSLQ